MKLEPVVTRGPHRLPLQLRGGLRCGRSCPAFVVVDHREKVKSCLETFVGGGEGSGVQRRREKLEEVTSEKMDLF